MHFFFRSAAVLFAAVLCIAQSPSDGNAIVLASSSYHIPSFAFDVAPGQVTVLHVHGIKTAIDTNLAPPLGPSGFPLVLGGVSVDLIQGRDATAIPIQLRAIYQTHCLAPCSPITGITLQIPFELEAEFAAKGDPNPFLRISENGAPVGGVSLHPVSDNVHVLNTCDDSQVFISAAYSVPQNICTPVVLVGGALNSLYNLVHGGQELAAWLYGMGATTKQAPDQIARPIQDFQLNFDFRPNAPAFPAVPGFGVTGTPLFAGYGSGLYQVNFAVPPVPAGLPACDGIRIKSNLTVTFTGSNSSDAAQLCVAP